MVGNELRDLVPLMHRHVGGVEQRVHFEHIPTGHLLGVQVGNGLHRAAELPALRGVAVLRARHADGPAGVDDQNIFHTAYHQ